MDIIESKLGDIVLTTCPHCGFSNSDDMQILFAAYRDNASLICVACKKEFFVELSCQTRAAELLRVPAEPEQSGAKPANKFDWLYPQGSQSPKWMTWLRSNRSGRG